MDKPDRGVGGGVGSSEGSGLDSVVGGVGGGGDGVGGGVASGAGGGGGVVGVGGGGTSSDGGGIGSGTGGGGSVSGLDLTWMFQPTLSRLNSLSRPIIVRKFLGKKRQHKFSSLNCQSNEPGLGLDRKLMMEKSLRVFGLLLRVPPLPQEGQHLLRGHALNRGRAIGARHIIVHLPNHLAARLVTHRFHVTVGNQLACGQPPRLVTTIKQLLHKSQCLEHVPHRLVRLAHDPPEHVLRVFGLAYSSKNAKFPKF